MNNKLDIRAQPFQQQQSTSDIINQMSNKEEYEQLQMKQQYNLAKVSLDEAFSVWQKEQFLRRKRFINQHGLEIALEKGYNVPFWQWWMNRLHANNTSE